MIKSEYSEKNKLNNEIESKKVLIKEDNPSIIRVNEKCIDCGICLNTCKNVFCEKEKDKEFCLNCGQCILTCPTGALLPKYNYHEVESSIQDDEKIVIAFTSPAVRVALGEEFGLEDGLFVEGKMISALRELKFDYVFDTTYGADLTTIEEANELINRLKKNEKLPMFTSCCPSWVKYAQEYLLEIVENISTCKSPIEMQSSIIKEYLAKLKNIKKENIVTVAITPCTAKKMEAQNPYSNTDYVITTSELGIYLREKNINFKELKDSGFDDMLSKGTGSGVIFGTSGGVMESALRAASVILTGKNLETKDITMIRGEEKIKEMTITIDKIKLNVAVIIGMNNVNEFLNNIKHTEKEYHFIEVMNCPGGCVGGGGQPLKAISKIKEARIKRSESLYKDDETNTKKTSTENKEIKNLYKEFLGEPNSEISKQILHTKGNKND